MEYVTRNKRFERLSDEELLYKLLQQRGVDNPKKLLQLNESCLLNAKSFNHIQEGMSMLTKHLNNKIYLKTKMIRILKHNFNSF